MQRVIEVIEDRVLSPTSDGGALLVVDGTATIGLPPIAQGSGVTFSVLPKAGSIVTLASAADECSISAPDGSLVSELTLAGQQVVTVAGASTWVVGQSASSSGDEAAPKKKAKA